MRRGAALGLVALLTGGAWLVYSQQMARPARTEIVIPVPTPTPVTPGGAIVPFEPPPSATTTAVQDAARPNPAQPTPPAAATVATPAPPPSATVAAAPPAQATATAKPAAAAPPPVAAAASLDPSAAYASLKAGRLAEAGSAFRRIAEARRNEFSVQLVVACAPDTIAKAVANDPAPELFVLPAVFSGKPCHRLLRGFYKTSAEADAAVGALPPYYVAEGARPRAVAVRTVLQ